MSISMTRLEQPRTASAFAPQQAHADQLGPLPRSPALRLQRFPVGGMSIERLSAGRRPPSSREARDLERLSRRVGGRADLDDPAIVTNRPTAANCSARRFRPLTHVKRGRSRQLHSGGRERIRHEHPSPELLRCFDVPGPRYTSQPAADRFVDAFGARDHVQALGLRKGDALLALVLAAAVLVAGLADFVALEEEDLRAAFPA